MRVIGIITARGGSKGVPGKNTRMLGGKPLLAWTAESALAAKHLSRVVVSTDDEAIASVARACSVEVPFMRPAELAGDATPTLPVLEHAVAWLEAHGEVLDAICLLQPTNPLRAPGLIDSCIDLLASTGADSVVTVLRVPAEHNPHWVYFQDAAGLLHPAMAGAKPVTRRQDLPAAYHREGSVYVTRRDVLVNDHSLYGARMVGLEVDRSRTVNIDTVEDWARAEQLVSAVR